SGRTLPRTQLCALGGGCAVDAPSVRSLRLIAVKNAIMHIPWRERFGSTKIVKICKAPGTISKARPQRGQGRWRLSQRPFGGWRVAREPRYPFLFGGRFRPATLFGSDHWQTAPPWSFSN